MSNAIQAGRPRAGLGGLYACASEASYRDSERAALRVRKAYAEGRSLQRKIDRLTSDALSEGPSIDLCSFERGGCTSEHMIKDALSARAFLQGTLRSRMTIMDLVDLADIASPIMQPESVRIEHSQDDDGHTLTLRMSYASDVFYDVGIERSLSLEVADGKVSIDQNDILLTTPTRGCGIGARFLLSTALFACRHGIACWEEDLQSDGLLAWPALGAEISRDTLEILRERLSKLFTANIVSAGTRFPERYFDIAAFTLTASQVKDWDALYAWLKREARVSNVKLSHLSFESLPVGALLLGGSRVSGEFHTERILEHLLEEHLPATIEKRREKLTSEARGNTKDALALSGLEESYRRGRVEESLSLSTQGALSMAVPAQSLLTNVIPLPLTPLKG